MTFQPRSSAYDETAVTAGIAAGVMFVAPDGRVLLLQRAADEPNYGGFWALPGGKGDDGETAADAAARESEEEIGQKPSALRVVDQRVTPNAMGFTTFAAPAEDTFSPKLNSEHSGFGWFNLDRIPDNTHPSVKATIADCIIGSGDRQAADMTPEDWTQLRDGFIKWTREEEDEGEHAEHAMDEARERLAFDRASVRTFSKDGHLHVSRTPISKANVCPYYGREIPNGEALGLDPDRRYMLLRDPEELAKAAPSSNGKPVLIKHIPAEPDKHPYEETVGATGTDAEFEHPYLYNSMALWTKEAIDAIETNDKEKQLRELSSAYRYTADMTPGTYEGVPYDGVMRDISFNHVAQVNEGRAGADVLVADNAINGEIVMSKAVLSRKAVLLAGAASMYLAPRLAQDSKFDAALAFKDVTAKNSKEKLPGVVEAIRKGVKLAKDAKLDDMLDVLKKCDDMEVEEGADADPNSGLPMTAEEMAKKAAGAAKDEGTAKVHDFLKTKGFDEAGCKAYDDLMSTLDKPAAADESDEDKAKREKEEADKKAADAEAEKKDMVSKSAMDAAIKSAVAEAKKSATTDAIRIANEIVTAKDFVRPWTGSLAMDAKCAEDVYSVALKHLGVDLKDVPPQGFKAILERMPKAKTTIVMDSAANLTQSAGFQERWGKTFDNIH